ncbi:MAG: DUF3105 domain-containing protein, partial [Actinobacteria bacterium]|nr:DUF3105 domain-containing protein [Actinomycetota bacterium]
AERAAAAEARRRRLVLVAVLVGMAALLAGFALQQTLSRGQDAQARDREVAARLDELGCTPIQEMASQGQGHFQTAAQLAASPPEEIYPQRPGSSGVHIGSVVMTGVYDKPVDERVVVHNLEHGYVAFWHDASADPAAVGRLEDFARDSIDGGLGKIVVAEYPGDLPDGASFATVAWGHRQLCEDFDADVAQVFLDSHHDSPSAPEPGVPSHGSPGQGIIDPDAVDGPLLFPPLGRAAPSGGS